MCGICGVISLQGHSPYLVQAARLMNAAIRHRGPDGEGFLAGDDQWNAAAAFSEETPDAISSASMPHAPRKHISDFTQNSRLVFGHRRLSIIDLSESGHQPLCTADQQLWINFNGEIYNHPELRKELEESGYKFHSNTDSEVILAAFQRWGEDCLHRFNGMWAFVIWDRKRNAIFGSRDRFGVKPFYYYRDKSIFTFASEQKALLKNPLVKTGLNPIAVADYFVAGEIEYREESFFSNILELFPGMAFSLQLNTGIFHKWKWYQLPEKEEKPVYTDRQYRAYAEQIRALFVQSVRLRLRADVPVGSCLSGGIDSSAISGVITDLISKNEKVNTGDRLKLFTAVFDDPEIDERRWAKEMVDRTGAEWLTVAPIGKEMVRDLEDLVYCQDVPIWSTSTYAQFRTMQLVASSGIRVVLDGQGGDELFAGYFPYFIPFWRELRKSGQQQRLRDELAAFGKDAQAYRWREFLKQRVVPKLPIGIRLQVEKYYFPDIDYLHGDLLSVYKSNYKTSPLPQTLNETLRNEFLNTRLKGYLKCEDRCSMWHSVESRTPFSEDYQLIEKVFSIPGTMKIRNGISKYLLREAVAPFIPVTIRNRRDKLGYVTPNNKWLSEFRDEFRPYFEQDFYGIIKKEKLLRDFDSFFNVAGQPENGRTFKFVAFAVWKKVMGL
ncbi:MAG TPA: asparagine synthase (glutamine-hydrolyzing) [Bacteroidia bacterium]|nr:asparagine synthase (glutamine-hydrolyzing) [Bacteroidia bacterium]